MNRIEGDYTASSFSSSDAKMDSHSVHLDADYAITNGWLLPSLSSGASSIPFPSYSVPWDDGQFFMDAPIEPPTPPSYADLYPTQQIPAIHPIATLPPPYYAPLLQFSPNRDHNSSISCNMAEQFGYTLRYKRELSVEIVEGRDLDGSIICQWKFGEHKGQTPMISNTSNPTWNMQISCPISPHMEDRTFQIQVKKKWIFGTLSSIGNCDVDTEQLLEDFTYDEWFPLGSNAGHLRCTFTLTKPILDNFVFTVKSTHFNLDDYTISQEDGNNVFCVKGQGAFDLVLLDGNGNGVIDFRKVFCGRKMFETEPVFDIYYHGTEVHLATISRKTKVLKNEFFIQIGGEKVLINKENWNNTVTLTYEDGEILAHIKNSSWLNKSFSVEILPIQNVPLMLSIAIVLDREDNHILE